MDYSPEKDGAIVAIKIWLKDGYKPIATLAFAFGGSKTIEWDNVTEREPYLKGINAYTIIYDTRTNKHPFKSYIK